MDAAKRRMNKVHEKEGNKEYERKNESEPPDKKQQGCQLNIVPNIDEYKVCNSRDELDGDNRSMNNQEDDEETCEPLIRTFSRQNDQSIEDEIQKATQTQELSPWVMKHKISHFKNKDIITVTAGGPNTRLFSSITSQ